MNEEYDTVVCGTGLVECVLSGLLSQKYKDEEGKRILHIDRNNYYGGEGASLNLTNLWKIFRPDAEVPQYLGQNRDWNIDLIPKFIMSNGQLVKLLLKTRVSRYLEWKSIDGTYVYQMKQGGMFSSGGPKIEKVPANDKEALSSDLMGLFEKRRCQKFFKFVQKYEANNPSTHGGFNLKTTPMSQIFKKFELEPNTIDFIGHAVALNSDDTYLNRSAEETIDKILVYMDSHGRYGDSPFIYPVYGLGGIPEGFSRMCAIFGGTFMLNTDIEEILFGEDGKVTGVRKGEEVAKCNKVICDPSYIVKVGLKDKYLNTVGKIIRCICIMDKPIPKTQDIPSVQVIIPQQQLKRKSDIYIMMVSGVHNVCKKGFYIAIISTMVETNNPQAELKPAFDLIGQPKEQFITVSDMHIPKTGLPNDGVFISKSFTPSSHFEQETEDVLQLYKRITGEEVDLVNLPQEEDE